MLRLREGGGVGLTLDDLSKLDPDAINSVWKTLSNESAGFAGLAGVLEHIASTLPGDGEAHDAVIATTDRMGRAVAGHADVALAVARAAGAAEYEFRDIKEDWNRIARMADRWGISINTATGQASFSQSTDAAESTRRAEIIQEQIDALLKRADVADYQLALAFQVSAGDILPDSVFEQLGGVIIGTPEQAEQDVQDALAGNQEAARRVAAVLNSITPDQLAGSEPLNDQQSSVLSQLQSQQASMSVNALDATEDRLGAQGHIIGDSWALLSNKNLNIPRTDRVVDAIEDRNARLVGGRELLPDSVQAALNDSTQWPSDYDEIDRATANFRQIDTIGDIVQGGNPLLQVGTDLDTALMQWSTDTINHPLHDRIDMQLIPESHEYDYNEYVRSRDDAIASVYNAAGRDHDAVHDMMTGPDGHNFLNAMHEYWWSDSDDAKSVHTMLDWIGQDARSPDIDTATRAGESAFALASYVNSDAGDLLRSPVLGGTITVGEYAPELVRADAAALAPFQRAMVLDFEGTHGFGVLDGVDQGKFDAVRNVFAVMDSEAEAAKMFTGEAQRNIYGLEQSYAINAANDTLLADSPAVDDMKQAANLSGIIESAARQEAIARGVPNAELNDLVYNLKRAGIDWLLGKGLGELGVNKIPGMNVVESTLSDGLAGAPNTDSAGNIHAPVDSRQDSWNLAAYNVVGAINPSPGEGQYDIPRRFFNGDTLLPPDQVPRELRGRYGEILLNYLNAHHPTLGATLNRFANEFDAGNRL